MAIRYPQGSPQARHAFWATGIAIYVLWNLGTLIGALGAAAPADPRTLGLGAAGPAGRPPPGCGPPRAAAPPASPSSASNNGASSRMMAA